MTNCRQPIRMRSITNRKNITQESSSPRVTVSMCNYAREVLNSPVITELASNVSDSTSDCNRHWETIIELTEKLDEKEDKAHPQLYRLLEYEIFPKLNKANLQAAIIRISESTDDNIDKELCTGILEDNLVMERIINNHKSLSKRFNFDKLAKEAVRSGKISEGVDNMCDLIDTYNISLQAKFNIALENITYAMSLAGYNKSVVEEVADYFLCRTSVIPDSIYETMQNLIKDSRILSESDKTNMKYFTEAKNDTYTEAIKSLAASCKNSDASKLILSSLNIKNEKQASSYIKKAMNMANGSEDADNIIKSIFAIPLMGKVSKAFVSYQYKLANDKIKVSKKLDGNLNKKIEEILDDDDETLMVESSLVLQEIDYDTLSEEVSDIDFTNTALLESEDYGESDDIKSILNDFKADQKKSVGKFRYYLSKIYKKSPESIIDETPNILAVIRAAFIVSPMLVVPVIGPVISLVLLFVDRLLSMKINEKQCNDLIKKLKSEREKVDKDIEKKPEKKDELEKYGRCIDSCIKKVTAYKEAHISDGSFDDMDDSGSDDLDMDLDFKLEQALVLTEAMNTILEARRSDISGRVYKALLEHNADMDKDDFLTLLNLTAQCNRSVKFSSIAEAARIAKRERPLTETTQIEFSICDMEMCVEENTISSIVTEAYYVELLEQALNEGFNFGKVKLLFQAVKGKMKDLSLKEKEFWRNMDINASGFMKSVEKAMTSNRREGIIKGSLIPSFSKCIKSAIAIGAVSFVNPIVGIIAAMGMIGVSKALNDKERQMIYDEIDTELKVVDKEIEMANNDGDMKKYRCLLQYQKRLERERQRIKYGIKVHGRSVPMYDPKRKEY